MFVAFSVTGLFFVVYGIVGGEQGDSTFGLACLAMGKAANAMLRTYEIEQRAGEATKDVWTDPLAACKVCVGYGTLGGCYACGKFKDTSQPAPQDEAAR